MAFADAVSRRFTRPRATLATCGAGHFLHDGYHDLLLVLLPIWQLGFGLSLTQVGLLMTCYTGAMAGFQIPAGCIGHDYNVMHTAYAPVALLYSYA